MSAHPNLTKILTLFKSNENFSMTEKQYYECTGALLPKNDYYLKSQSALAKAADKNGYVVIVHERTIICERKK